jgi:hypothetical protein
MSQFQDIITIGFDKYDQADFRISMAIASLDSSKINELCAMMPWAIKEALSLWLHHGPQSKEAGDALSSHEVSTNKGAP